MASAFFVTGTDTGAGKTLVTASLLLAAASRGFPSLGLKPIASGSEPDAQGRLRNEDALALQAAASVKLPYEQVNQVTLGPAIAPHIAAAEAGIALRAADVAARCRAVAGANPHELLLIEGAGGWRVPLNAEESFADIPRALRIPVVLVVGLRLGCVNHALLTAEAIRHDGLRLAGWVGTQVEPGMARLADNLQTLRERIDAPMLGWIPWQGGIGPREAFAHLDPGPLLAGPGAVLS
ncbi:MAG: dethiobiotin synthase [Gammaproteobacteria bacterium]